MKNTTFDKVVINGQFVCNGTHWVKRSSRTASLFGQPGRWFYFSKADRVEVSEKWFDDKGV